MTDYLILGFLMRFVAMAIAMVPFVLMTNACRKTNLKSSERYKQSLMPIVALLFTVLSVFFIRAIHERITNLIRQIPLWIQALTGLQSIPAGIQSFLTAFSQFVTWVNMNLDVEFISFAITNWVMVLFFLIIKVIALPIMGKYVKMDDDSHRSLAAVFYEFVPDKGQWCLQDRFVQTSSLFKAFFYGALALSTVASIVWWNLFPAESSYTAYYPALSVLVLGEILAFLDGGVPSKPGREFSFEDEDSHRVVNYSLVRGFLRNLFGDKLLAESTGITDSRTEEGTVDKALHQLESSEDPQTAYFGTYMRGLHKSGFEIDRSYLRASVDLMNGKNILFNNPFYNDLIPYAFYPMNRVLLSHKKVLVISGRHSMEEEITTWIEKGIGFVTKLPFLWNITVLGEEPKDADIGILTRAEVLNVRVHHANATFLQDVGLVVILEPSKLISTAQIGLNLVAQRCGTVYAEPPAFCMCDKNCDGLVDALSHILMTSLTEVSATGKYKGTSSYMCWEAGSESLLPRMLPNISRYLGFGTELSFAALKNQVSKVSWYGGDAFPVTDVQWINKQYYYDLMRYAGLPASQKAVDEHFEITPTFWSSPVRKDAYLTVEDESFNMFEILRDFSTRAKRQGFVNVISSDYLLKDYMAGNAPIFENDPKAIPYISPDFARTRRNMVLQLILRMSEEPIDSETLERELRFNGIEVFDLQRQLWFEICRCFSPLESLGSLSLENPQDVLKVADKSLELGDSRFTIHVLRSDLFFNVKKGRTEIRWFIRDAKFLKTCIGDLCFVGYIAEDDNGEKKYLGAELAGHTFQKYLPGQFFTFGGKYYEMQGLSAAGEMLVRRAADHITGRYTYRQKRKYTLQATIAQNQIGAKRNVGGFIISREYADFMVETPGYYRMERYNDFQTAKEVCFGKDTGIPTRTYHAKEILRVELPGEDFQVDDALRYTLTLLMNELFRTLFAENQAYIVALTDTNFLFDVEIGTNPLTFSLTAKNGVNTKNAIFIMEDSSLDLGLTVAVERNLERIFQIMADYLDWHLSELENCEHAQSDPPKLPVVFEPLQAEAQNEAFSFITAGKIDIFKSGKIKSLLEKIKASVNKPKAENTKTESRLEETEDQSAQAASDPSHSNVSVEEDHNKEEMPIKTENDEPKEKTVFSRAPYASRHYLLFGAQQEIPILQTQEALSFLVKNGFDRNGLKRARMGRDIWKAAEQAKWMVYDNVRRCDFCGAEIYGVEYETLFDGRDRCVNCGSTAVNSEEEFRQIFEDVRQNMELFFGIKLDFQARVQMVNTKELNRRSGKRFVSTPEMDERRVGYSVWKKRNCTIYVENGTPRIRATLLMAYEMTHAWQFLNWRLKTIKRKYGNIWNEVYEGMAKWTEIQYAYLMNEPAAASREIMGCFAQDSVHGRGFIRFFAKYSLSEGTVIERKTPFEAGDEPLDKDYCGEIRTRSSQG